MFHNLYLCQYCHCHLLTGTIRTATVSSFQRHHCHPTTATPHPSLDPLVCRMRGHDGEISKVAFSPSGARVITASSDRTARIWDAETGDCLQVGGSG
jgi:WD40 repeat protein